MSFHVQAYTCVLSYKYKESTHFDCCLVKRVQWITVLKVYECHPLGYISKSIYASSDSICLITSHALWKMTREPLYRWERFFWLGIWSDTHYLIWSLPCNSASDTENIARKILFKDLCKWSETTDVLNRLFMNNKQQWCQYMTDFSCHITGGCPHLTSNMLRGIAWIDQ